MKKILLALFLATSALTFSFATTGDSAPTLASEQGDNETDSDQAICYDFRKNLGPVNTGTYRNADRYTNGEVTKFQQFLHDEGFLVPEPTGFFGAKTKAATIKYQKSKNFDILSGYVGPMTRAAIKSDTCNGVQGGEGVVACTMEARLCDDGSMMPRGPSDCTWHPNQCPGVTEVNINNVAQTSVLQGYSTCTVPTYTPGVLTNSTAASLGTCTITLSWPTVTTNLDSKVLKWQFTNGTTWFGNTYLTDSSLSSKSKTFTIGKTSVKVSIYSNGSEFTSKTLSAVCATGAVRDASTGRCIASANNATLTCVSPLVLNTVGTACVSESSLSAAEIQCNAIRTQTNNGWSHYVNANGVCVSASGVSSTTSPTFNFTTASYTVPAGTQIRLNWYQIAGATSCVASGGWSGSKDISNSANGSSELVTVNAPTTYTLTCANTSGGTKAKSITVQIQSTVTATGTPELILKVNNSKGPIDAVVNRFGGSGTTVLNADWISNVDVTNCSLGSGFRLGQTVPSLTQTSSRSGAIEGSPAYRSWVSTTPQGVDYQMSCKRISASGYSEVLWSNTVRVDTCDVGFHIVRDGSFNGGTCVTDTQTTPTCTATQTLTNGVCVDTAASVTPSLTLTPNQYVCAIKLNESTCRISVKVDSVGVNSVKYYTSVNSITSNQTTATTGNLTVNFDITNGTTNVVFNGYYGSGSSNLQANRVLTAACETGTWNGSVCSGGSVSALPTNPLIQTTKTSVSLSESFIVSWQADGATSYKLMIDGVEKGPYTQTSFSTSLATLGLSSGVHTFSVQGCNASGCGAWSSSFRNVTITGVVDSPVASVSISTNKTSISSIESVLISWGVAGATKYRLIVDGTELPNDVTDTSWSGPLGFPTPPGLGLPSGAHTFKVKAFNGSTFIGESNTVTVILRSTVSSTFNALKNTLASVNGSLLGQGQVFANVLSGATAASASSDTCTNITNNLHRGYETPSVSKLQNFLIAKGFLSEKASGFFGDLTIEAVKAYQRSVGIPQTGMVYDATREAIMVESCQ